MPGLILQAYNESDNIYFSVTDIKLKEVGSIGPVTLTGNEEVITLASYKEITKNFEKYQRQSVLKSVRPYIKDEKGMPEIIIKTKPVRHMEIFDEEQ